MGLSNLLNFKTDKNPLDQAQELAWEAMDERDPVKRKELAKEALKISKNCTDAYVLLAYCTRSVPQAIKLAKEAIAAGTRVLGPKKFKDLHGSFWGFNETRPYMRAKALLAELLEKRRDLDGAIEIYQEMLELNPRDNQGIRHELLPCLYKQKRDQEIAQLFNQFPDDAYAYFYYHHALWLFRKEGEDSSEALQWLEKSIERNSYVPPMLLGKTKIPKINLEYIQLGKESEAIAYVQGRKIDWNTTRGALFWLNDHFKG